MRLSEYRDEMIVWGLIVVGVIFGVIVCYAVTETPMSICEPIGTQ